MLAAAQQALIVGSPSDSCAPYSSLGAGAAILKNGEPVFTFLAMDATDHAAQIGLSNLLENGCVLLADGRLPYKLGDLLGYQGFGGTWSRRSYRSVDPTSYLVIPGQGIPAPFETGSWSLY